MLTVNWVNDGRLFIFHDPNDFRYWVEWQYLNYKPYQMWNLEPIDKTTSTVMDVEIFAGVYRYIGHKYLGELILNKDENKTRQMLQRRIEKRQSYIGTYRP